jgi:hypothetical protein
MIVSYLRVFLHMWYLATRSVLLAGVLPAAACTPDLFLLRAYQITGVFAASMPDQAEYLHLHHYQTTIKSCTTPHVWARTLHACWS